MVSVDRHEQRLATFEKVLVVFSIGPGLNVACAGARALLGLGQVLVGGFARAAVRTNPDRFQHLKTNRFTDQLKHGGGNLGRALIELTWFPVLAAALQADGYDEMRKWKYKAEIGE